VKYVITLDTDTQLTRDSAFLFVGTMAHPLNRARYDEDRQRVTEGYGILQPRVAATLTGANRSRYARLCGSEAGIDPYTRAVSDVYQDLFGKVRSLGRASMKWMPSSGDGRALPDTGSSVTIFWKGATRGLGC